MPRGRVRNILGLGALSLSAAAALPWAWSAHSAHLLTLTWPNADFTVAESGGVLDIRSRGNLAGQSGRPTLETETYAPDGFRWRLTDEDRWPPGDDFGSRLDDHLGLLYASLHPEYTSCPSDGGWAIFPPPTPRREFNVRMTGWLPSAALLPPAAFLLLSARRARRRETPKTCRRCGYDLTGVPGGCPECGLAPKAAA